LKKTFTRKTGETIYRRTHVFEIKFPWNLTENENIHKQKSKSPVDQAIISQRNVHLRTYINHAFYLRLFVFLFSSHYLLFSFVFVNPQFLIWFSFTFLSFVVCQPVSIFVDGRKFDRTARWVSIWVGDVCRGITVTGQAGRIQQPSTVLTSCGLKLISSGHSLSTGKRFRYLWLFPALRVFFYLFYYYFNWLITFVFIKRLKI
jgi:hypothetical protein